MPTLPHGTWPSPITSDLITRAAARVGEPRVDGRDVWWQELRPEAGGQVQLVRRSPDRGRHDSLPEGFSARTRVHEYGGGAWTVSEGVLFFANWADQRMYRIEPGGEPVPITAEPAEPMGDRYADLVVAGDHVVCVRERHGADASEPRNEIVAVPAGGGEPVVLVTGPDFVAGARLAPDLRQLSWFSWNHPDMPWDGTELFVAPVDLARGSVGEPHKVAGGRDIAVTQAFWSPTGVLHFCSDEGGWWNLFAAVPGEAPVRLTDLEAEIGTPHWVFGQARYAFLDGDRIVVAAQSDGIDTGLVVDADRSIRALDIGFTDLSSLASDGSRVVACAASFTTEPAIVSFDPTVSGSPRIDTLSRPRDLGLDASWFSIAEPISFSSGDDKRTAHALYYPPTNPDHDAPDGAAPPLVVKIHGGPTSAARPQLSLGIQYWTSRGFAVVDVNYGGSTGYGRAYRELLDRQWGIVDVEDCIAAARFLAGTGRADPARLCITGGSAGGFTVLAALCFSDVFGAGASHYGVADLEALATETHKFESRYLDRLIGPYPEARQVYLDRSPIHHVDSLSSPLIVFQGLEDEIVPPNQAEMIVEAVRAKGVPVAYVPFEGEQHGFRKAENIQTALDGELAFYGRVLGFVPAGDLPDVPIDNL